MKSLKLTLGLLVLLIFAGSNAVKSQWAANGTHIYNTNSGFVGIGNNTPGTLLHVGKNMTEPNIRVQNFGGAGGATFQMIDNASGADWKFKATNTGGFKIRDNANALDVISVEANSFANAIYVNANGSVGLGTSTPGSRLHLEADAAFHPFVMFNSVSGGNAGLKIQEAASSVAWIWRDGSTDIIRIANSSNAYREDFTVLADGRVGIGTSSPASGYALSVNGKIVSTEVLVDQVANWPDYVFHQEYDLMNLQDLEASIKKNNHLPGIPSAAAVEDNGVLLGDMQKKLLQKIEELTLYTIEQDKQISDLQKKYDELVKMLNTK